jgi:hypothetical protein
VLAAGVLVIATSLICLPLYLQLPWPSRVLLTLGAGLYVAGALGFEALSADAVLTRGDDSLTYYAYVVAEESLESVGTLLAIGGMIYQFNDLLSQRWSRAEPSVGAAASAGTGVSVNTSHASGWRRRLRRAS